MSVSGFLVLDSASASSSVVANSDEEADGAQSPFVLLHNAAQADRHGLALRGAGAFGSTAQIGGVSPVRMHSLHTELDGPYTMDDDAQAPSGPASSQFDPDSRRADTILHGEGLWTVEAAGGVGASAAAIDATPDVAPVFFTSGAAAAGPSTPPGPRSTVVPVRWSRSTAGSIGGSASIGGGAAASASGISATTSAEAEASPPPPAPDAAASAVAAAPTMPAEDGPLPPSGPGPSQCSGGSRSCSRGRSRHRSSSSSGYASGGGAGGTGSPGGFTVLYDDGADEGDDGGGARGLLGALDEATLRAMPPALLQVLQQLEEERDELAGRLLESDAELSALRASYQQLSQSHASSQTWLNQLMTQQLELHERRQQRQRSRRNRAASAAAAPPAAPAAAVADSAPGPEAAPQAASEVASGRHEAELLGAGGKDGEEEVTGETGLEPEAVAGGAGVERQEEEEEAPAPEPGEEAVAAAAAQEPAPVAGDGDSAGGIAAVDAVDGVRGPADDMLPAHHQPWQTEAPGETALPTAEAGPGAGSSCSSSCSSRGDADRARAQADAPRIGDDGAEEGRGGCCAVAAAAGIAARGGDDVSGTNAEGGGDDAGACPRSAPAAAVAVEADFPAAEPSPSPVAAAGPGPAAADAEPVAWARRAVPFCGVAAIATAAPAGPLTGVSRSLSAVPEEGEAEEGEQEESLARGGAAAMDPWPAGSVGALRQRRQQQQQQQRGEASTSRRPGAGGGAAQQPRGRSAEAEEAVSGRLLPPVPFLALALGVLAVLLLTTAGAALLHRMRVGGSAFSNCAGGSPAPPPARSAAFSSGGPSGGGGGGLSQRGHPGIDRGSGIFTATAGGATDAVALSTGAVGADAAGLGVRPWGLPASAAGEYGGSTADAGRAVDRRGGERMAVTGPDLDLGRVLFFPEPQQGEAGREASAVVQAVEMLRSASAVVAVSGATVQAAVVTGAAASASADTAPENTAASTVGSAAAATATWRLSAVGASAGAASPELRTVLAAMSPRSAAATPLLPQQQPQQPTPRAPPPPPPPPEGLMATGGLTSSPPPQPACAALRALSEALCHGAALREGADSEGKEREGRRSSRRQARGSRQEDHAGGSGIGAAASANPKAACSALAAARSLPPDALMPRSAAVRRAMEELEGRWRRFEQEVKAAATADSPSSHDGRGEANRQQQQKPRRCQNDGGRGGAGGGSAKDASAAASQVVASWAASHWLHHLQPLARSVADDDELPESMAVAHKAVLLASRLCSKTGYDLANLTAPVRQRLDSALADMAAVAAVHVDVSYSGGAAAVEAALAEAGRCLEWVAARAAAEEEAAACRRRCSPRTQLLAALRRLGLPSALLERDMDSKDPGWPDLGLDLGLDLSLDFDPYGLLLGPDSLLQKAVRNLDLDPDLNLDLNPYLSPLLGPDSLVRRTLRSSAAAIRERLLPATAGTAGAVAAALSEVRRALKKHGKVLSCGCSGGGEAVAAAVGSGAGGKAVANETAVRESCGRFFDALVDRARKAAAAASEDAAAGGKDGSDDEDAWVGGGCQRKKDRAQRRRHDGDCQRQGKKGSKCEADSRTEGRGGTTGRGAEGTHNRARGGGSDDGGSGRGRGSDGRGEWAARGLSAAVGRLRAGVAALQAAVSAVRWRSQGAVDGVRAYRVRLQQQ